MEGVLTERSQYRRSSWGSVCLLRTNSLFWQRISGGKASLEIARNGRSDRGAAIIELECKPPALAVKMQFLPQIEHENAADFLNGPGVLVCVDASMRPDLFARR
jgi:hypothetical protein